MLHLAKYLEKNIKVKAPLSRCLQTAKKEFVIQLLILYDSLRPIFCVRK